MKKRQKGSSPSTRMKAVKFLNRLELVTVLVFPLFVASCNNRNHDAFKPDDGKVPLTISVGRINEIDFGKGLTKAKVNVGEVCTRLSFAIYTDVEGSTSTTVFKSHVCDLRWYDFIGQDKTKHSCDTLQTNIHYSCLGSDLNLGTPAEHISGLES